ncbi:hypothetical protein [Streptomyces sp. NPDC127039]|uniref:hypothetical protein n=1 Tax=Streptomyces sp. NPDC127039 TaxID=3347115 RepID=UPI00366A31E6
MAVKTLRTKLQALRDNSLDTALEEHLRATYGEKFRALCEKHGEDPKSFELPRAGVGGSSSYDDARWARWVYQANQRKFKREKDEFYRRERMDTWGIRRILDEMKAEKHKDGPRWAAIERAFDRKHAEKIYRDEHKRAKKLMESLGYKEWDLERLRATRDNHLITTPEYRVLQNEVRRREVPMEKAERERRKREGDTSRKPRKKPGYYRGPSPKKPAPKAASSPRRQTSHAECEHEATRSARAKCRRARGRT